MNQDQKTIVLNSALDKDYQVRIVLTWSSATKASTSPDYNRDLDLFSDF